LRDCIMKSKDINSHIDKYRCSKVDAGKALLTDIDKCVVPGSDPSQTYYAFPTIARSVHGGNISTA